MIRIITFNTGGEADSELFRDSVLDHRVKTCHARI